VETKAELRKAIPRDQPGLDIVRRQAIEMGLSGTYDRNDFADRVAKPDPRLPEWIEDEDMLVLVISDDLTPFAYGVYDRSEARIRGLYTGETYREEGHASRIVDAFEREAQKRESDLIRVDSPRNAVEFFKKLGYEERETTTAPRGEISLQSMVKNLTERT
jgi:GNAT superfamily N-acetyltransferase